MGNTKPVATGARDAVRDAAYILQHATDALRTMCATRRADGDRIDAALLPMEAARRGGVLIDGVPCSLWGVDAIDDADMVCDAAQTFEDAWRDFARAFDFPAELSKRLEYVLDSMCDPGCGALAGTQYAKEGRAGDIYADFTPENYAKNVLQFRIELESVRAPGYVFEIDRPPSVKELLDALADRFGSATAAELCGMRQDLRDYLDASDMRSWHIGCEKLAADMISKERTAAQGVISGIVRRLMVQIERGAAELARTEAATGTQGAKRGDGAGAANVAERQVVAASPRFPQGKEASQLQAAYVLHNACKGKDANYTVVRNILDRKTLADWDGVPVRMFDDSGEALGYMPNSDSALRQWVRRARKSGVVKNSLDKFRKNSRVPDL